ncbi:MAG: alpha/beta fold hydrolase [Planctomycetota bacterium]
MYTTTVNGAQLCYEDRGQGRPLLLVHGFPLDHTMWRVQIQELAAEFRVIAPDLRGFGRSDVTHGTVTMAQFADDLAALLDAMGVEEPCVLGGLSMGGYVAFEFFRRHRDRLAGLVLCDTRAQADTPEAAENRRATAARVLHEGLVPLAESMLPRFCASSTPARRPHIPEELRDTILRIPAQGVAAAALGMAERSDATSLLPEIDCPTLLIVGSEDVISPPEEMQRMSEAIPGARLVVVPDAGHLAPLENPAATNAAIREFLAALPNPDTAA